MIWITRWRAHMLAGCALIGVFSAASAWADTASFAHAPVRYVEHGVVCAPEGGTIIDGQDTIDGEVIHRTSVGTPFNVITEVVPARVGLSFGVAYTVLPTASAQTVVASVTHPPMGAQGRTTQRWSVALRPGETTMIGYHLEEPREEVPGPWTFRLIQGDRVILQHRFDLVPRGVAGDVDELCFGDTPRS